MKSKKKPIILIVFGALLSLGPVWGLLGTIIGMIQSFQILDKSGMNNSEALESSVGFAINTTYIGLMMVPAGLILLIPGIIWLVKIDKHNRSNQRGHSIAGSARSE